MRLGAVAGVLAGCGGIASAPDASIEDASVDSGIDVVADAGEPPDDADWHDLGDPKNWVGVDIAPIFATPTQLEEGACFDGRFVYWGAIVTDESGWHSAIVRYDTHAPFTDLSSWVTWSPTLPNLENRPMVFDGRYVYLGISTNEVAVRYDTTAPFGDMSSLSSSLWLVKALPPADAGYYSIGARTAAFDGRYVYFPGAAIHTSPLPNRTLRFDTQGSFQDRAAWSASPPQSNGWTPAIFADPYIVLTPMPGLDPSVTTVLYDTRLPFEQPSSWASHSLQPLIGDDMFAGAGTAKGFVYYVPLGFAQGHDDHTVVRYDTTAPISSTGSWQTFQTSQVNPLAKNFQHASWDGRFLYFMVGGDMPLKGAVVARYDTTQPFQSTTSWSAFDMTPVLPAHPTFGSGPVFDGEFLYVPMSDMGVVVMRFHVRTPAKMPKGFSGTFY